MTDYVFYNGIFLPFDEIRIPLSDRAVFFGDGIYDVAVGYGHKMFQAEEHIDRLLKNSERIFLPFRYSKNDVLDITEKLLELSNPKKGFTAYFQISRASKRRSHLFDPSCESNLLITLCSTAEPTNNDVSLISCNDGRYDMCDVKTLNLLPSVLAANKARSQGADEAVFIRNGVVTECSHSNLFILKNDILYTHPATNRILNGIMRQNLISCALSIGVTVYETKFGINELTNADEILITSTTAFVRKCIKLDGNTVGGNNQYLANRLIFSVKERYYDTNEQP